MVFSEMNSRGQVDLIDNADAAKKMGISGLWSTKAT